MLSVWIIPTWERSKNDTQNVCSQSIRNPITMEFRVHLLSVKSEYKDIGPYGTRHGKNRLAFSYLLFETITRSSSSSKIS